ncbi:2OG-Fe(II) oxygenase [Pseudoxanthomonas sacheonensis]|uniref:2OG-Fe(II) oxygenase n=1 Tax=Pseudoxanthomonas sacheonensis TaxID=443615 RepID=UPI0013D3D1F9|nr:2OG-Fe(II) oxygenase family protein [Pseudoxanthomonas sacheonensis]KAF1709060.1 2OG-Fe(II) oxygenase [Pseudoxanthomonas sacheonensis]
MISNELEIAPYRQRLLSQGRVQIPGFLQEASAERLRQCLRDEVPWQPALRTDRPVPAGAEAAISSEAMHRELLQAIYQRARDDFEFVFDRYRMIEARRDGLDPGLVLHVVVDFLNSPPFLEFARELTGDNAIRMVSAIAARYRSGHFLKLHNDKAGDEDRAFAYVINLSQGWQADWGGLLQFLDEGQNVIETFTPHWNSLSLFRVPQAHQVSLVAPWAKDDRYSITGWFRRS